MFLSEFRTPTITEIAPKIKKNWRLFFMLVFLGMPIHSTTASVDTPTYSTAEASQITPDHEWSAVLSRAYQEIFTSLRAFHNEDPSSLLRLVGRENLSDWELSGNFEVKMTVTAVENLSEESESPDTDGVFVQLPSAISMTWNSDGMQLHDGRLNQYFASGETPPEDFKEMTSADQLSEFITGNEVEVVFSITADTLLAPTQLAQFEGLNQALANYLSETSVDVGLATTSLPPFSPYVAHPDTVSRFRALSPEWTRLVTEADLEERAGVVASLQTQIDQSGIMETVSVGERQMLARVEGMGLGEFFANASNHVVMGDRLGLKVVTTTTDSQPPTIEVNLSQFITLYGVHGDADAHVFLDPELTDPSIQLNVSDSDVMTELNSTIPILKQMMAEENSSSQPSS